MLTTAWVIEKEKIEGMKHTVRQPTPADAALREEIQRIAYTDDEKAPAALSWFPGRQRDAPDTACERFVALAGDLPAGYAALWMLREQRYRFDLLTHPLHRNAGAGKTLFDALSDAAATAGAKTLQARVSADSPESVNFALRRGFVETQRMTGFELDLRALQIPNAPAGISVITLEQARSENRRWLEDLIELLDAAQEGWPDPDGSRMPAAAFARLLETAPRPDAFFVAEQASKYLGISSLYTLGTAVHPKFLGAGIGSLLHAHALDNARRGGLRRVTRPSANPAMQAIFRKLGYRPGSTEIRMTLSC